MTHKIRIGSSAISITLNDQQYVAAGGEAAIYVSGGTAYKLYHEPAKKMLPVQKIKELSAIVDPHVIIPQDVIFDAKNGEPLGYTMPFIDAAEPLLKYFTKTFKTEHNIDPPMIAALVRLLQCSLSSIHGYKCLVVDLNELNVLVKNSTGLLSPLFIDVNSYSTPSFKATAIMDSVRDRRVTSYDKTGALHYAPDELSDWFSWGILSFWLYTNIHPFRGNHPKYKPREKAAQMDDGISIFHKDVRVPPTTNNFGIIPKRHLDWFKAVFERNERSIPPLPDSLAPTPVPTQIVTIKGTDIFEVFEVASCIEPIISVFGFFGINYLVGRSGIYKDGEVLCILKNSTKTLLIQASNGTVLAASLQGAHVAIWDPNKRNDVIGTSVTQHGMFVHNNALYTTTNSGKLVENTFTVINGKIVQRVTEIENISRLTSVLYDGCVIQDLLGKKYLTVPYAKDKCFSKYLKELDGYRIIDAKSKKHVTVIVAEKGGIFNRFIVIFAHDHSSFYVRETKDIAYDTINFTVTDTGLCVLLASPTELELFAYCGGVETLPNPPLDSTMRLFSTPGGIFFINGNSIHQLKRK